MRELVHPDQSYTHTHTHTHTEAKGRQAAQFIKTNRNHKSRRLRLKKKI